MPIKKTTKTPARLFKKVAEVLPPDPVKTSSRSMLPLMGIGLLLVVLGLLAFRYKEFFIVAIVNGRPVFRYELNQRLTSVYGKETLENLLIEKLIREQASKEKITVSEKQVDDELARIEKSLGEGTKIEDVLKLQGVSLQDFREQLKMRLAVNQILEKQVTVSDEEVSTYLKESVKNLTATTEAERKTEATQIIKESKINTTMQTWLTELLQKAKIDRWLK